jgi:hypothetical protein
MLLCSMTTLLEEFMAEAVAVKERDLRLKFRRIRPKASRDSPRDIVWLDFAAPHNHLVVDVTVTSSARTNSNVMAAGGPLPLPVSLAQGAQKLKLDTDIRTSPPLARRSFKMHITITPSPELEDGGLLAPIMAARLVDRLAILVLVRRFLSLRAADSCSMKFEN